MYALFIDIFLNLGNFCLFSNTNLLKNSTLWMAMHFSPKEMTFHLFWDAAKFGVVFFIYWDQVWSLKKRKDWSHLSSLLASYVSRWAHFPEFTCWFQLHLQLMKRNRSCLLSNRTSRWPLPGTRSSDPPVCSQSGPWCGWIRGGYLLNCILCSWASLHLNSCAENTSTFTKVISSRRKSCSDVLIALFYMAQQI